MICFKMFPCAAIILVLGITIDAAVMDDDVQESASVSGNDTDRVQVVALEKSSLLQFSKRLMDSFMRGINRRVKRGGNCNNCGNRWSPVCGSDGRTYRNQCQAQCRNKVRQTICSIVLMYRKAETPLIPSKSVI